MEDINCVWPFPASVNINYSLSSKCTSKYVLVDILLLESNNSWSKILIFCQHMLKLATNNGFHELLLNFNFPMLKKWPWFKLLFLFKKRNLCTPINDIKKMDLWSVNKIWKENWFSNKDDFMVYFNGIQKQYI